MQSILNQRPGESALTDTTPSRRGDLTSQKRYLNDDLSCCGSLLVQLPTLKIIEKGYDGALFASVTTERKFIYYST